MRDESPAHPTFPDLSTLIIFGESQLRFQIIAEGTYYSIAIITDGCFIHTQEPSGSQWGRQNYSCRLISSSGLGVLTLLLGYSHKRNGVIAHKDVKIGIISKS
jgi:hypothetical protein